MDPQLRRRFTAAAGKFGAILLPGEDGLLTKKVPWIRRLKVEISQLHSPL